MTIPTLTVTLFGAPTLSIDEGPAIRFQSSKVAALAYYFFATGRAHSRDALAGLLWPDYDNAQAKKNLRGALYHLRNALAPYVEVTRQEAGPATVGVQVDVRHFDLLLQQAASHPTNSPEQIARLRQAAACYIGPFLEGFHTGDAEPFEEWMRSERDRLAQMAGHALNALVVHALETGDYLQGVQDATRLLALDSLQEETHRHLMMMLALDGRQDAALTHYERCVALLDAELGVEPDPATQTLAARIRAGDFSPVAQFQLPPPRRHNLPADVTPFLDRERETQQILRVLADPDGRLITLVGAGGIGKTRLAIHVGRLLIAHPDETEIKTENNAENDPKGTNAAPLPWSQAAAKAAVDGVYLVRLAGVEADRQTDSPIVAAVAAARQIRLAGNGPMLDQLMQHLQHQRLVLILDNFEQLQPHTGLVAEMLASAEGLRVIVTSRTRLNLRGEQTIALDGLPAPEPSEADALLSRPATALFVAAAKAATADFAPHADDAPAIIRICRLLQGLPLGIELAASWTRVLTSDEIARELQEGLDLLSSDMADLPPRHRSLRTVFDHSWSMLPAKEQAALGRLAIFRGGFDRQAASTVAGAGLASLAALVDHSLVKRTEVELESGQPITRYELPEVVRQYALERLQRSADEQPTAEAHAHHYAGYLAAMEPQFHSDDQIEALEQLTLELENARAAWRWACRILASQGSNGRKTEDPRQTGRRRHGEAQEAPETVALDYLRRSHQSLFDFHDIRGWFEEGERLFRRANDALASMGSELNRETRVLLARLQARQAWFRFHLGEHAASEAMLLESLATLHAAGADAEAVFNLAYLGAVKRHTGDLDAARTYLTQALTVAQQVEDRFGASMALNTLGQVAWLQGDFDATIDYCQQALTLKRTIGDRRGMIYSLTYLGRVAEMRADYDAARGYLVESMRIAEALDDPRGMAQARHNLANLAYTQGDLAVARRLYQSCLELYRHIGSRIESSIALTRLGEVAVDRGEYAVAAGNLHLALENAIAIRSKPALLTGLLGAAQLQIAQGKVDDAGRILALVTRYGELDERQRSRCQRLAASIGSSQDGAIQDSADPVQPDIDGLIACALECGARLSGTAIAATT